MFSEVLQIKKMVQRLRKVGLIILLIFSIFGIAVNPALADEYEVLMGSNDGRLAFVPMTLKVHPGDKVKWILNKVGPHNVVFDQATATKDVVKALSHDQLAFAPGSSWEITIPEDIKPGQYRYYCTPHRGAGMVAFLVVEK